MKTKFAQLASYINTLDQRYIQLAYLALAMVAMFVAQKPSDGGVGPI